MKTIPQSIIFMGGMFSIPKWLVICFTSFELLAAKAQLSKFAKAGLLLNQLESWLPFGIFNSKWW